MLKSEQISKFKMLSSREGLLEREKEIIKMLSIFLEQNLDFIVVGGYAIATYKKRFSIDLDLIIGEKEREKLEVILKNNDYSLSYDKKIELLYGEEFKRFIKKIKELPVNIDLLINGLISRTTNAVWDFDYIKKHSRERNLDNLKFLTPERELLIAMKLHSGRLADIRDVVALMPGNSERIKKHILRGDIKKLKNLIENQEKILRKPQFADSFKGIFGVHVYKNKAVEETKEILRNLVINL